MKKPCSTVVVCGVRINSQVQISHRMQQSVHHYYAVLCEDVNTFTVVGEMEQERFKAAGVWSECVPNYFTEQYDCNVVLHLKRTQTEQQIYLTLKVLCISELS